MLQYSTGFDQQLYNLLTPSGCLKNSMAADTWLYNYEYWWERTGFLLWCIEAAESRLPFKTLFLAKNLVKFSPLLPDPISNL